MYIHALTPVNAPYIVISLLNSRIYLCTLKQRSCSNLVAKLLRETVCGNETKKLFKFPLNRYI